MSEVFLFYQDNILKGIYDDYKILKKQSLHYILDYHVKNKIYNNKTEVVDKLKQKLYNFYKKNINFLESNNIIWSIVLVKKNQLVEKIKTNGYVTPYTKLNIKGKNCREKDLFQDLAFVELDSLYTVK